MKTLQKLLFVLVATLAVRAPAEYLLWSVDWTQAGDTADYATLVVLDNAGNTLAVLNDVTDSSYPSDKLYRDLENPSVASNAKSEITSPYNNPSADYQFAIKVYDSGNNLLGSTTPVTYSELPGLWGSDGQSTPSGGTTFSTTPTNYNAVPEPATGMLFLAGALMLFRRKRNA
jgi:hypothetical protein